MSLDLCLILMCYGFQVLKTYFFLQVYHTLLDLPCLSAALEASRQMLTEKGQRIFLFTRDLVETMTRSQPLHIAQKKDKSNRSVCVVHQPSLMMSGKETELCGKEVYNGN